MDQSTDMTLDPGPDMPGSVESKPVIRERRRSARQAAPSANSIPKQAASPTTSEGSSKITSEPRRNPKRKASEAASQPQNLPDNLLEEALKPLTPEDIEEWEGWIELESEPAFFNIILRDLGVKDVKAQEIFTIDQTSLEILPKPVFGLIFLFQYGPGKDEGEGEEDTGSLWFANQTTNNACATVALLNIVMNATGVELGEKLREFKESTNGLSTALRGHRLSQNGFIRAIHNSFTRRMEHLNADLVLENEVTNARPTTTKRRAPRKGVKSNARKKKKLAHDYGYHFIAYVPADGFVWELDGLRSRPHKLGPIDTEQSWTNIARPQIEARILQYEDSQLSFNLLALCQSPLILHSCGIAKAVASLRYMQDHMRNNPDFANLVSEDSILDIENQQQLSEFDLTKSRIEDAEVPDSLKQGITQLEIGDAYNLYQQLVVDVKATMGEFRAELLALAEDEQRVKGRKKDYGQALHKWVQKLAEKGVLEEVIESSS